MKKDARVYFKEPFNFEAFTGMFDNNNLNFVDEGPGSGIEMDLAINEFD
jgi:hypothetical protein